MTGCCERIRRCHGGPRRGLANGEERQQSSGHQGSSSLSSAHVCRISAVSHEDEHVVNLLNEPSLLGIGVPTCPCPPAVPQAGPAAGSFEPQAAPQTPIAGIHLITHRKLVPDRVYPANQSPGNHNALCPSCSTSRSAPRRRSAFFDRTFASSLSLTNCPVRTILS